MTSFMRLPRPLKWLAFVVIAFVAIIIFFPPGAIIPIGVIDQLKQANPGEKVILINLQEGETVNVVPPPPPKLSDCGVFRNTPGGSFTRLKLKEAMSGGTTKFVLQTVDGGLTMLGFAGDTVSLVTNFTGQLQYTQLPSADYVQFLQSARMNQNSVKQLTESVFRKGEVNGKKLNIEQITREDLKGKMGFDEQCQ